MSTFGTLFRVSTFGESHCKGVGAVVDGCPPGLILSEEDIQPQLTRRRPGQSKLTTPRDEKDLVTILSGTEHRRTLGTPIGLFVPNENVRPQDYKEMSFVPRPGHADYTYEIKYGVRASSGGGRSSARETIGRVAAGAIAEKFLRETFGTDIVAWVSTIGTEDMPIAAVDSETVTRDQVDKLGLLEILRDPKRWKKITSSSAAQLEEDLKYDAFFASDVMDEDLDTPAYRDSTGLVYNRRGQEIKSPPTDLAAWSNHDVVTVRCPEPRSACRMATLIRKVKAAQDSTGGVITCVIRNVPPGLGEPCFDKLEAKLAHAMLSLPATKGFEIGSGFAGVRLRGSQHNDMFMSSNRQGFLRTKTNNAGGTLGGISSGESILFRVAVKPVSTIGQAQNTVTFEGEETVLEAKGRHDPCVLPRTSPLVESMAALVLADAALIQRARGGDSGTWSFAKRGREEDAITGETEEQAKKRRGQNDGMKICEDNGV